MSKFALIFSFYLVGIISPNSVVYGGLLPINYCSLQPQSIVGNTIFEIICGNVAQYGSIENQTHTCDVHCQCAHGNVWGECLARNPGSMGLAFGSQLCQCYPEGTKAPPAGHSPALLTDPLCQLNHGFVPTDLCTGLPLLLSENCNADCLCTHGLTSGTCLGTGPSQVCKCNGPIIG